MLSVAEKFIFIHIPKTGGNSLQNVLAPYSEDQLISNNEFQDGIERFELENLTYGLSKHARLQEYCEKVPAEILDPSLIFTCIRNPWERMISYYFSPHRQIYEWSKNDFIVMLNEVENSQYYLEVSPEFNHLRSKVVYMRVEELEMNFAEICREIPIPFTSLSHRNKSNHGNYQDYYDEELIKLVEAKSKFEIEFFGYSFEK